ncbi:macro domain-containing protein [Hymenobacter terrenus]|uniref:macro domain-containing protein n=1 Tax=Hymenobacter terrenus TaxID=1629124 RepID=UPI000619DE9B|nr:macro domain-containing protein [Hymenobacter terrenus]
MMQLILADPKEELCQAWRVAFECYSEVEIFYGRFENIQQFDCMVSAANSFGLMDGGVDLAIRNYFGNSLQLQVQRTIIDNYNGEQPVGTSFIVETNHPDHPFLAHTPTMRVPMPIDNTDNVYQAMKAMLQAVKSFNAEDERIKTVVCPGLGTATGRVPFEEAARQMEVAYRYYKNPPQIINWPSAAARHRSIMNY